MKRTIAVIICLSMLLSVASFAKDKDDPKEKMTGKKHKYGMMHEKWSEKLDLSKGQKDKIKELREKLKDDNKDLKEKKKELSKEIKGLMDKDDPDMGKVEDKVNERSKINAKLTINKLKMKKEKMKILTKEQKEELKELKKEWKEKKEKMMKEKKEKMKEGKEKGMMMDDDDEDDDNDDE